MLPKHLSSHPCILLPRHSITSHPHTLPATSSQRIYGNILFRWTVRGESGVYGTGPGAPVAGLAKLSHEGMGLGSPSRLRAPPRCLVWSVRAQTLELHSLEFRSPLCHLLALLPWADCLTLNLSLFIYKIGMIIASVPSAVVSIKWVNTYKLLITFFGVKLSVSIIYYC